jgi:hypothetical protein
VLQETLANFEVRCCASQRLHQARRSVHSCVQAAVEAMEPVVNCITLLAQATWKVAVITLRPELM